MEEAAGKAEEEFPQIRKVLFQEKGKVLDRKTDKWSPLLGVRSATHDRKPQIAVA